MGAFWFLVCVALLGGGGPGRVLSEAGSLRPPPPPSCPPPPPPPLASMTDGCWLIPIEANKARTAMAKSWAAGLVFGLLVRRARYLRLGVVFATIASYRPKCDCARR